MFGATDQDLNAPRDFLGRNGLAVVGGDAGLGQAAPLLNAALAGTITDILPVVSGHQCDRDHHDRTTQHDLSANAIAAPLRRTRTYLSALWNVPLATPILEALTFGTTLSLTTAPGWDNVTGLGVANPVPFIASFVPLQTTKN